jgi:hypothetical protein
MIGGSRLRGGGVGARSGLRIGRAGADMRDVSQISPPIRIVLAVAALFLVAWMTVLKPKSADPVTTPTPITQGNVANGKPAVSAPGKMAEKARSAVQNASREHETTIEGDTAAPTSEAPATGAATGAATGSATGAATATSGATAATPAATGDLKGLPAPVVKAIAKQQVMVIGFFDKKAADDRAVRSALAKVDRWNGRVFVKAAPIGKIGRWSRIAKGVDVEQSPTVVVVGRDLKATALVGFADTRTIDQAVVDAMREAGGLFTSAYLREVNKTCASASSSMFASPQARNVSEAPRRLSAHAAILASFAGDLRGIKAPARYKAFKAATVADVVAVRGVYSGLAKAVRANPRPAAVVRNLTAAQTKVNTITKGFDTRMERNHVVSCRYG